MFLKTLDIVGFKSFAHPVRVELGPGITAIVGPNGSGKSNIVDAVRWVLGEQSARAIRGTKSEDVIFNGSAARHAQGLAEVTMVLDNADGRVAVDLAEVAIARRLYRSGETEYLLNRRRARLRDVLDVAGQAGLGPDSYCVIGQGAIEQLVLQRPSERRALLADAADIRRHESRLAEIESSLAETQQNALRISAVVAELRPRLERLRQQADRAERHRRSRDDAERVARGWFGRALPAARRAVDRTERDRIALQAGIAEKRVVVGTAEERRAMLHARLRDARAEAAAADAALAQAQTAREASRLEVTTTRTQSQALAAQLMPLRRDQEAAEALVAELRMAAALSRDAFAAEQQPSPVASSDGAHQAVEAHLRTARAALTANERQIEEHRRLVEELERARVRAQVEDEAARANAANYASRVAEIEVRASELEARQLVTEQAVADARERLRTVDEELAGLKRSHAERQAARRSAEEAVSATRRVLDRAAGEERALAGLKSGAGVSEATLVRRLPAPTTYQRAVAAALGAAARYGVVAVSDDAWEADATARAETVLVPERGNLPAGVDGFAAAVRGVVGTDFLLTFGVDVLDDSAYGDLARRYLGQTLIVHDLDTAIPLARRLRTANLDFQIATQDGHCLRSNGEHALGPDEVVLQGIELRQRQEELRGRLSAAQAELTRHEGVLDACRVAERAAEGAVRVGEDRRRAAGAALAQAQEQARSVQAILQRERTDLDRLRRSAPRPLPNRGDLEPRLARARAAHASAVAARPELAAAVEAAEVDQRAAAAAIAQRSAEQRVRVERLARLEQAMQRDGRELQAAEQHLASLQNSVARVAEEVIVLDEKTRNEDAALNRAEAVVAVAGQRATAAHSALEAQEMATETATAALEAVHAELADLRTQEATVATAAEHASGVLARLEVEVEAAAEHLGVAADDLLRPTEPVAELERLDDEALQRRLTRTLRELRGIGQVDYGVLAEFRSVEDRCTFLAAQLEDLAQAETLIREGMDEARQRIHEQFRKAFDEVNAHFKILFRELFRGGDAELILAGEPEQGLAGVDIVAQPPGKRLNRLATLSGGERALVGAALLLALISANPSPFCMLDEVDAALDEANVHRFVSTIREMADQTQFVLVTHNRSTMEMADALYGVTMNPGAVSQVLAVRLPG